MVTNYMLAVNAVQEAMCPHGVVKIAIGTKSMMRAKKKVRLYSLEGYSSQH